MTLNQKHDFGASFRYLNEADLWGHKNILTLGFNPVWNLVEAAQYVNRGIQLLSTLVLRLESAMN